MQYAEKELTKLSLIAYYASMLYHGSIQRPPFSLPGNTRLKMSSTFFLGALDTSYGTISWLVMTTSIMSEEKGFIKFLFSCNFQPDLLHSPFIFRLFLASMTDTT